MAFLLTINVERHVKYERAVEGLGKGL